MDAETWENSKRGFPFNIKLEYIVFVSFGVPLALSFCLLDFSNQHIFDVVLKTLILALIGFITAVKLIPQFKENMELKGLFGKDLNKSGKREDKPAV